MVSAATLRVGPGETYAGIQLAINAAAPGDTIEVRPGLYQENLVVNKSPLALAGARAADDARGRVAGAPDPAVESIVAPVTGNALQLASPDGTISVSGFSFVASVGAAAGVVSADAAGLTQFSFSNNHVRVSSGAAGSPMWLNRDAIDSTITGNVFIASAESASTVALVGGHSFHGLRFEGNHVLRVGLSGNEGFHVDGDRNLGPSALRAPLIKGNLFRGHAVGFYGGARSLMGAEISGNTFDGNAGGMAAGPRDSHLSQNEWSGNSGYGLKLTSFGNVTDSAFGARGNIIENNRFLTNGSQGDLCFDPQAAGTQNTNVIRLNRFASPVAVLNNDPAGTIQAAYNYWGAADGPGGNAPGSGGDILGAGAVAFEPFYADDAMTSLVFGDAPLTGTVVLQDGQSITGSSLALAPAATLLVNEGGRLEVDELVMPSGSGVVVRRGSAVAGKIDMQPGAVLDVVDGELSLDPAGDGQYHTIAGSFTFFNCLGSLQINGNTSFSGATLGLASDIHVLSGSTMLVLGSLVLDGCRIDSSGTFSLLVNTGAILKMTRCEVKGAAISLVGSDVTLKDNQFVSSSVTAFSTVNGAAIYHNVFTGGLGLLNILPGAVVTTSAEGWGNVASPAQVKNELALNFQAPANPTRTLDSAGNLFVQPGDLLDVGIDIGKLNAKTQAVETLLGFSTDYLTVDSLLPSADWSNGLYQVSDELELVGKVNTAVGLGFSMPDPDGTTADGHVADIRMEAGSLEGRTRVFFRTKDGSDHPLIDTRLTASTGGVPYFKEVPFTRNAATLTVDGTVPEFAPGAGAVQVRESVPVDVLQDGVFTRMGTVTVTFDVVDQLAGIDDSDVRAELVGSSGILSGTPAGSSAVVIGDTTYTRWVFTFQITATTPDGVYDINAVAMDRSGNEGVLPVGVLEVVKNRITATVSPEGLITAPLTRDVVFTATNGAGSVLSSWSVPVLFNGGTGTTELDGVPDGTMFLSAKMAWNLRVRLPVSLNAEGWGAASFTSASMLPGGDFTGDNIVNLGDYNILRSVFPGIASAPDITGEGYVNLADYNILRSNWLTAGDPP